MRSYRSSSRLLSGAVVGAALASLPACDTVSEGKNDLVAFAFDAESQLIPARFSTPLAKGLRAGVRVVASESDPTGVPVIDAESASPSIVEVRSTAGNLVTLEALAVGTAEIGVTVAAGEDAFDVTVKDLAKVDLNYPGRLLVPDSPKPLALQGGTARFIAVLKDASGSDLVGYGALPVTIAPNGAATATSNDIGTLEVAFALTGTVTLTGQGDDALTMDVVAQADLTALEWQGLDIGSLNVGEPTVAVLRGVVADGSKVVGVASVAAVTTNDSAICTIAPSPRLGEGIFTVTAVGAGACEVSATLGSLADRATITVAQ